MAPGPACYYTDTAIDKVISRRPRTAIPQAPRFSEKKTDKRLSHPGPTSYDVISALRKSARLKRAPIVPIPKARRFSVAQYDSESTGPGSYDVDKALEKISLRSSVTQIPKAKRWKSEREASPGPSRYDADTAKDKVS